MSAIEKKVKAMIADTFGVPKKEVTPEKHFQTDLHADSLNTAELMIALEGEFNIKIPDAEVERMMTVLQVINYVKTHTSKVIED